ncbi:hypothetical protein ACOMHN_018288 [Nucella lapillus]
MKSKITRSTTTTTTTTIPTHPLTMPPRSPPPPPRLSTRPATVLLLRISTLPILLHLLLFLLLLLLLFPLPTQGLASGYYPPYDGLCVSKAPVVPAPWDCKGYIRCDEGGSGSGGHPLGGHPPRALWTVCEAGKLFDPSAGQCVGDYTGCPAPDGEY